MVNFAIDWRIKKIKRRSTIDVLYDWRINESIKSKIYGIVHPAALDALIETKIVR